MSNSSIIGALHAAAWRARRDPEEVARLHRAIAAAERAERERAYLAAAPDERWERTEAYLDVLTRPPPRRARA